ARIQHHARPDQAAVSDLRGRLALVFGHGAVGRAHRLLAEGGVVVDAHVVADGGARVHDHMVPDLASGADDNLGLDDAECTDRSAFARAGRGGDNRRGGNGHSKRLYRFKVGATSSLPWWERDRVRGRRWKKHPHFTLTLALSRRGRGNVTHAFLLV